MLFINRLDFFSFLEIIKSREKTLHIFSKEGLFFSVINFLLKLLGYNVIVESFFYGDIFSNTGEVLYMKTRRQASEMAFNYSEEVFDILKETNHGKILEDELTLKSFISKRVVIEFEYYLRRVDYITSLKSYSDNFCLLINEPKFIDSYFLNSNTKLDIKFYNYNLFSILKQEIKLFLISIFSSVQYLFFSNKISDYETSIGIATEPISLKTFERHYPHWVRKKNFKNFIIINDTNQKVNVSKNFLKKNNIKILGKLSLMYLPLKKEEAYIFNKSKKIPKNLRIQIKKIQMLSKGYLQILKKYRCNKFIFSEPQDYSSDAILLCKKYHKISTYCIQFSNIGYQTPLMISPVDYYLCFSETYKPVLKWKNITPKNFLSCGYSFYDKKVDPNMTSIKDNLSAIGVKKIISFFDESIQYDKWGLISFNSIKSEYEDLASFILSKKDYAVIIKPQFMVNSLNIFKSNIIENALKTKRLIEIKKGSHRNIITPQQVGSISDISISNLIGGTAGIEAAMSGSSVFFINPLNYKPNNYDIINKYGLIYQNLKEVLLDIDNVNIKKSSNELIRNLISNDHKISKVLEN